MWTQKVTISLPNQLFPFRILFRSSRSMSILATGNLVLEVMNKESRKTREIRRKEVSEKRWTRIEKRSEVDLVVDICNFSKLFGTSRFMRRGPENSLSAQVHVETIRKKLTLKPSIVEELGKPCQTVQLYRMGRDAVAILKFLFVCDVLSQSEGKESCQQRISIPISSDNIQWRKLASSG